MFKSFKKVNFFLISYFIYKIYIIIFVNQKKINSKSYMLSTIIKIGILAYFYFITLIFEASYIVG